MVFRAGGSPVSGVDRMTGAGVAGDVETGDGEAAPLHPQSNIADNTQIPESKRRFLRTVAVIKGLHGLLNAVHHGPLMLGSGTERPSGTALGWATFASSKCARRGRFERNNFRLWSN